MVEHGQVQPAIVYPDADPQDLAISHRLLHGQRRWSAALLAGLPTLWVVEVPKPSTVIRLLRAHRGIEQVQRQAPLISDLAARAALLDEAQRLMVRLQSLVSELSATRSA
jgi:ParB-like chromosome segregation protein Spo0J